jgi:6,7-dimethyl-8-ribityllumazine synthase
MATAGNNLSAYNKENLPDARHMRFGLVVSEWNARITENLYEGAKTCLIENGVALENITRLNVPGAFELPYGAKKLAQQNSFDAIIVIGCVIQGDTRHFDFVCQGVTHGIAHLNIIQETPIIFCVLTDNTLQQSIDRSGGKHGNKGTEAAVTALKMGAIKNG